MDNSLGNINYNILDLIRKRDLLSIKQMLLSKEIDPNIFSQSFLYIKTAIEKDDIDMVGFLIDHNARLVDEKAVTKNLNGDKLLSRGSAFHVAARSGNPSIVRELILRPEYNRLQNQHSQNPSSAAIDINWSEFAIDPYLKDSDGKTAMDIAKKYSANREIANTISDFFTLAAKAIGNDRDRIIKDIAKMPIPELPIVNSDYGLRYQYSNKAQEDAEFFRLKKVYNQKEQEFYKEHQNLVDERQEFINKIKSRKINTIDDLKQEIENGADINIRDKSSGKNALEIAIDTGDKRLLKILIDGVTVDKVQDSSLRDINKKGKHFSFTIDDDVLNYAKEVAKVNQGSVNHQEVVKYIEDMLKKPSPSIATLPKVTALSTPQQVSSLASK